MTIERARRALDTSERGLASTEARKRLEIDGPNALPAAPRRAWLLRFLDQFRNVLIYILLLSALASGLMGHAVDAAVIAAVVLLNALIGMIQEHKAERAMAAIGRMLARTALVRRDGRWQRLPAEELVRGDLVRLEAGDRVPADLRLVESHTLQVDQAALTGESMPIDKAVGPDRSDAELAERSSMLYSGSLITRGTASAWVAVTGANTELGRISHLLAEVEDLSTPLLKRINQFGRRLTVLTLLLAIVMLGISVGLHGQAWGEGLLAAIALIVAAIPEGLPAIITITLAVGVRKMGKRKAIIRHLPAVETLGSVNVICSDKTGTLTRNELAVRELALAGLSARPPDPGLSGSLALAEAASLCNDAGVDHGGDPIEKALLDFARAMGLDPSALRNARPRDGVLPFSPELRLMATRHGRQLVVKGAPEALLARASAQINDGASERLDPAHWHRQLEAMTAKGLRVLAIAEGRMTEPSSSIDAEDDLRGLGMLGLVGFADAPRAEARGAVRSCQQAGIELKMITGDHAETARAVATELGLAGKEDLVLNGRELDRMEDAELEARASSIRIVARATPEHKLRLVKALQAGGQVVAMTGDGANDAPALKRADVGVAMGIKGTEAARQAADMVLADDNFATLEAGVEEGRGVYDNIRKALLFILPTNVAETLVILLAVLAGSALPITPVQILWVNLVTTVTLELSLAFETLERDVMRRPPRAPEQPLLGRFVIFRILWVGLLLTWAVFWLHGQALASTGSEAIARTVAINVLVIGELVYLFNCRRWQDFAFSPSVLVSNPWVWWMTAVLVALQLALSYAPPFQVLFGTAALSLAQWLPILAVCAALAVLVEIEKWITRSLRLEWASPSAAR
ncbi:carbonate dehydratase [Wenzhouxiangella marina]|uniref:Carbonate dehydratase n=2 Tax=Wenzhouxiangella marina TaxID=1579979 RepID=A0A0K0XVY4_9GAMM|nr:carbonate dehydratase [Wenzhouxiangella marina]